MKHIEVTWQQLKSKSFRGKEARAAAQRFVSERNADEDSDEIQAFEVVDGETTAWFDTDSKKFTRHEMDG